MKTSKNLLEKFLSLFTVVKAGEGITAILLSFNLFVLMCSYYIMKSVREALILAGGGAEVKSYAAAGQAILLIGAVKLFSMLASRMPRRQLINAVTIFYVCCLGLFYVLAQINVPLGVVFYLWLGIFNLMMPALLWSFSNDIYSIEAGKRIFVIIAVGAQLGAIFGSYLAERLVKPLGVYQLLLAASGILILVLFVTNIVDSREKREASPLQGEAKQDSDKPIGSKGAFQLVFRNRYLLLIAFLMISLNLVNTTGEYILGKTILGVATEAVSNGTAGELSIEQYITMVYAGFYKYVNIATLLIQLFAVSRILKYFGTRVALLILPVIALLGYSIIIFFPVLAIVRWAKTAENSTDYSLQNTVRQVLFLPTTREQKYKAKQAIDTFFVRAGDVLSAVLVFVGTTWLSFRVKEFAVFNLGLVIIWIILALIIGREYRRLVKNGETSE
ncbi:NTP/NDP exchange transporter [Candidatus Latescibacterota bacterium]